MKQRSLFSFVAALVIVACMAGAAFAQGALPALTHHVRTATQTGDAKLVGHLPATQTMRIIFTLPLRNQPELNDFLRDVYDPASPIYRHFLTVEQFTEHFGPTQADYDTLTRFAQANGLSVVKTSRNRLNLDVTGTVENIEKALNISWNSYQHPTENRTFYAPDREPTPNAGMQVWHISGLDNFSTPTRNMVRRPAAMPQDVQSNATTGSCPQKSFCGSDMRAAYVPGTTLTGAGQSLGLFELIGTDLADLTTYFTNAHQTNNVPITLLSVDGQSTSCLISKGCDDGEQTLDMTQAIGMAPGMSSLVMYIGKGALSGQSVDDAGIFNAMATANPLNAQLSSSWAWRPADPNTDTPFFQEFAAQGQNLFDAAGDSGHWTASTTFVWPADSPFLTSVGGTDLSTTGAAGPWASETAWVDGGGGISPNKFPIPSWQVAAAAGCGDCSQSFRNGPDVSANANFTFYVCSDQEGCSANQIGGTSFAAPMWAGFLALVNQQAVANGNSVLGFINPALYSIGLGANYGIDFHDVTSGSNGLPATVGYDLATGWGSPNLNLINDLAGGSTQNPDFTITASPTTITVAHGKTGKSTITTTISGGFNSAIALTANLSVVKFKPASIAAPGAGTSTFNVLIGANVPTGSHKVTVTGTGGGKTHTTTVTIVVTN